MKILKTLMAVTALLFTFGVAESAMAVEGTIYSIHLSRTNMSDHNTSTTLNFTADIPQTGAELIITNGGTGGKKSMISSATVTLNGERIAGPKDFGKKVVTISRIVDLDASNTMKVKISPCKNCELDILVIGDIEVASTSTGTGNTGVKPGGR